MKSAIVELDPEPLPEAAGLIRDHGLEILGSLNSASVDRPVVRLVVAGDQLPDACEQPVGTRVVLECTTESYGSQRLTRISDFRILETV